MMRSERVLVKLVAKPTEWVGDELRFAVNSGDAGVRAQELKGGYRMITQTMITASDDLPTHTYADGRLVPLRDRPAGYAEIIPEAEPFATGPALIAALVSIGVIGIVWKLLA